MLHIVILCQVKKFIHKSYVSLLGNNIRYNLAFFLLKKSCFEFDLKNFFTLFVGIACYVTDNNSFSARPRTSIGILTKICER